MRTSPGLAAIGAGLIHLGVAAGSPPALLVALTVVGAAEVGWGVAALARDRTPGTRTALGAAVVLVAVWVVVLLLGAAAHHRGGAPLLPVAATAGGAFLDLAVAAVLAVRLRRPGSSRAPRNALAFLLPSAGAAGAVAVIVATSLASTSVGAGHLH